MKTKKNKIGFGVWLLSHPKAFQVTMMMSAIGATFIFGVLAILGWVFRWNTIITIIWSVFAIASGWKTYKYFKVKKMLGNEQFANYTLGDFMNIEQIKDEEEIENGRKGNGEQSEKFCSEQSNADDEQPVGEKYKGSSGRVLESEEESEFTDVSFSDYLSSDKEDSR